MTTANATCCDSLVRATTHSPNPLVNVSNFAPNPPWEVAIPARPTGPTALSVARNQTTSEPPRRQI
eukprot:15462576-Alexandrium_andersonii.AAC.1